MTNYRQCFNHKETEATFTPTPDVQGFNFKGISLFIRIWNYVLGIFDVNNEPRIKKMTDNSENTWWKIYDPVKDKTFKVFSKEDLLIWLEERHYQRKSNNSWDYWE